jgi:hypothetical protein
MVGVKVICGPYLGSNETDLYAVKTRHREKVIMADFR